MKAISGYRSKSESIFRRSLLNIIDKMFKSLSDDKSYSQLEYENYVLRSHLERATRTADYFR